MHDFERAFGHIDAMAPALFTIGYEGTDIHRFVETLRTVGIEVVADVRAVPISRKPGFSKTSLAAHLADAGIRYEPFKALGDPKPGRDAARGGRFAEFRAIYGAHLETVDARAALSELAAVAAGRATCLLCFERDPTQCHRSIVATSLATSGLKVVDLFGDDPRRYVRYGHRLPGRHRCEGAAATQ